MNLWLFHIFPCRFETTPTASCVNQSCSQSRQLDAFPPLSTSVEFDVVKALKEFAKNLGLDGKSGII